MPTQTYRHLKPCGETGTLLAICQHYPFWYRQKFISHSSKIKVPVNSESDEGPLPGSQMTIFSMCPQIAEEARELSVISFIRALIHSLGAHSYDLIASQRSTSEYHHLGVKVSTVGLVETHSIYSKHPVFFSFFSFPV